MNEDLPPCKCGAKPTRRTIRWEPNNIEGIGCPNGFDMPDHYPAVYGRTYLDAETGWRDYAKKMTKWRRMQQGDSDE